MALRWPFRRSSGDSAPGELKSKESGLEQAVLDKSGLEKSGLDKGAAAALTDAASGPAPRAAWRDLTDTTAVLGKMPSATDKKFSRTLPTRWHTPPALGTLGHEVRSDVPSGLVSGAARTVDPRDSTPADLVWRAPEIAAVSRTVAGAADALGAAGPMGLAGTVTRSALGALGGLISPRPQMSQTTAARPAATKVAAAQSGPSQVDPYKSFDSSAPAASSPAYSDTADAGSTSPATADIAGAPNAEGSPDAPEIRPLIGEQPLVQGSADQTGMSASDGQGAADQNSDSQPSAGRSETAQIYPAQSLPGSGTELPATLRSTAGPQISVPPTLASADTAQARRELPDAATAVEARDPRPVPADVTDGTAAAAPEPGVIIEPDAGQPASPPGAAASGLGPLLTPREARSGLDPSGSAPTVAPLVSRNTLSRNPLPGNALSTSTAASSAPTSDAATSKAPVYSGGPGSTPETLRAPTDPLTEAPAASDSTSQPAESEGPDSWKDKPAEKDPSGATPASADESSSDASAPAGQAPSPPAQAMSVVAPLVSAAARFIPSSSPISTLQGPSGSGDQPGQAVQPTRALPMTPMLQSVQAQQPMQAVGSLVGGALRSFAGPASPATQGAAAQSPTAQGAQAPAGQSPVAQVAQGVVGIASALPALFGGGSGGASGPGAAAGSSASAASGSPSSSSARHEDPAALDSLARQLYGRFSRHLAGELLIDRERSQFLTDLG